MRIDELIIAETADYVAINKPSGLLSIAGRDGKEISLKQLLQQKYGEIYTVHRLDKETSGLIIFARNEKMHKHFSAQFENRSTVKIYHGLIIGKPSKSEGEITEPIAEHPVKKGMMTVYKKGKESHTVYQVLENFRFHSWASFNILTGRTHQIRVHMKYLGQPIACDELYGDGKPIFLSQLKTRYNLSKSEEEERPLLSRLALHSSQLQLSVLNGDKIILEAPLPKDLKATLNQLRKWT